jgi:hypothetical protein
MCRKKKLNKEIQSIKESKSIDIDRESYVDYNPLEMIPDVIDKDYGFFLMFGKPDKYWPGTASTNFQSIRSVPQK